MPRVLLITMVLAWTTSPGSSQQEGGWPLWRPAYETLRQDEDWSVLADEPEADVWDPIKFISLSEDHWGYLTLGASARARGEVWRGFDFGTPASADDEFLLSRVLFHGDLRMGEHVRIFAEGKTSQATTRDLPGGRRPSDVDYLAVQQLFFDLSFTLPVVNKITLRPGRQMLSYGNERLVSPLDWSNTLNTWDGASLGLVTHGWAVNAFWGVFVPVDGSSSNEADEENQLIGIYATKPGRRPQTGTDLYWIVNLRDDQTFNGTTGDEDRQTFGARHWGKTRSDVDYEFEGAFQAGEIGSERVNAFMLTYELGYRFPSLMTRAWLGADYASGDDEPGGSVQTFNQLFPDSHTYLGLIDTIGRQNIVDFSAGIDWSPLPSVEIGWANHLFHLANENDGLYDATGTAIRPGDVADSRYVGFEVDLTASFRVGDHLTWSLGYGHFFADAVLRQTGASDDIDFFYVSADYRF